MSERNWKLGDDMRRYDAIFDEITFRHIIDALHCNEKIIDSKTVHKVAREILKERMLDFMFLIENNIDEIIAEAMEGRN